MKKDYSGDFDLRMETDRKSGRRLGRQIAAYIFFGVLTTVVSFGVYYALMEAGHIVFVIGSGETGAAYMVVYTVAQLVSWVCAVLFAFFTNRAYVFTDSDRSASIPRQLVSFAAGRLVTLGLDYVITLSGAILLRMISPSLTDVGGLNLADLGAKAAASVIVMVCNYFFSRIFVFRRSRDKDGGGS